jgi:hypothetical protein
MRGNEGEMVDGDHRGTRRHLYSGTFDTVVEDVAF